MKLISIKINLSHQKSIQNFLLSDLSIMNSANKTAANLLKLKQSFYEQGEKSGKILAWRIKQKGKLII